MLNMLKCPECSGDLEKTDKDVEVLGKIIGQFTCEVCKVCGSTFLDEEIMKKVEEKTKEVGLFGLEKTTKVSISGNSLIIRINKALADFLQLTANSSVRIYPIDKRRFVVEKT
ncbi:MAG: hypothetical protein Q6373_003480 [Candidatus Sigynarchaeota archaeon]